MDRSGKNRAQGLGRLGEDLAARFLEDRGFSILERNLRLRNVEVDLVAQDREGLVFVEVKSRSSDHYGSPYEAVDEKKRKRLIEAATDYIGQRFDEDVDFRLGIVSIVSGDRLETPQLEWIDES